MRIDLTNVDAENEERTYIKREGEFTLKVVKVTQGKTSNGNDQIKVHFQDRGGQFAMDEFVLTQNSLWKLKVFTKALKLPNIIDTNMFIDRYACEQLCMFLDIIDLYRIVSINKQDTFKGYRVDLLGCPN